VKVALQPAVPASPSPTSGWFNHLARSGLSDCSRYFVFILQKKFLPTPLFSVAVFAFAWFYYHRRCVVAAKSSQLQQNEETLLRKIFTNLLTLHSLTSGFQGLYLQTLI
jgi:hypothetical protein